MYLPKSLLTVPPATLPVSLTDVKTFLRVDGSSEDAVVTSMIKAATQRLEELVDFKFVTQTWEFYFDGFPSSFEGGQEPHWDGVREGREEWYRTPCDEMLLPFGPIQSATIKYYDEANTEYTLDPASYYVDTISRHAPRLVIKTGYSWPSLTLRVANAVKVTAVIGLGLGAQTTPTVVASTIPDIFQESVKQFTGIIYENRGDQMPEIPTTVSTLLEPYRKIKV